MVAHSRRRRAEHCTVFVMCSKHRRPELMYEAKASHKPFFLVVGAITGPTSSGRCPNQWHSNGRMGHRDA